MSRHEKAIETIREILSDRGYIDCKEDDEKIIGVNNEKKICVFTKIIEKLNVSEIGYYSSLAEQYDINHFVLIYNGIPTPVVKTAITTSATLNVTIEHFDVDDLQFNLTKHELVPLHRKLDKEEAKEFIEKYGSSIPKLLRTDPVSRYYNFVIGDIVEVKRKNGFISYRKVF